MLWIFIEYNLLYRLTFALEYIRSMIVYYYTYIFFDSSHLYKLTPTDQPSRSNRRRDEVEMDGQFGDDPEKKKCKNHIHAMR